MASAAPQPHSNGGRELALFGGASPNRLPRRGRAGRTDLISPQAATCDSAATRDAVDYDGKEREESGVRPGTTPP